ncbi:MAG: hypothetical protein N2039_04640 [Gemmataceae bacterium]|nr:hypothetical protein [Gemmataceae bacterium]
MLRRSAMRHGCWLTTLWVASAIGCDAPKLKPTEPTQRAGGLVSQIKDKAEQMVTAVEMKDLHLFMDAASAVEGRLPNADVIREAVAKENPQLAKLLQDGRIILTGIRQREGVWAYEKDAPEKGGWIIDQSGPRQVTAEEFQRLVRR